MRYYLVVFDRARGQLVELIPYAESRDALRERFRRETSGIAPGLEIVVLGAPNEEALRNTHARYFGEPTRGDLAEVG